MKPKRSKSMLQRLMGSQTAAQVAQELGGGRALTDLLKQTGYAGQPQGLAARLANELERGLPLRLEPQVRRAFSRFFDGPAVMEQARQEAAQGPLRPVQEGLPASQVRLSPEETAALWPASSGQRFLRLARAGYLVQDDDLLRAALGALDDFCQANPPLMGPAWQDTATLAARAGNWLWGLRFLERHLTMEARLAPSVVLHLGLLGQLLAQALETPGQAAGPSRAAAAGALLLLGCALPFLPEAEAWRSQGGTALGPALLETWRQGPCLASAEAAMACEWGGLGLWTGGLHQVEMPELVAGLRKLAELCRVLSPPWGSGPYWGWTPAAPVLGFQGSSESPFSAPANLASVLLTDPELRTLRRLDERLYWIHGPEAADKLRLLAGGRPPQALEAPGPGLAMLGAVMAGRKVGVALCLGPQPASALALGLSLDGLGLIVPPGPAGNGPLGPHLAARAAHNAARMDELEPQAGEVVLESLESGPRHRFLAASFHGYTHLADPVVLRRRVYLDLAKGLVNLVDQVQANGQHLCELFFRLPAGSQVQVREDGSVLLQGQFGQAVLRPDPKAQVSLFLGRSNPTLGWAATRLGQVVPAPVLRVRALVEGNARLSTVLALGEDGQAT